ncbi:3'-5' exonuclease [Thermoleptolyngbya sp.]
MTIMVCKSLFKSLEGLSASDTKRVTDFIPKFYENPANPGISLERVTRAKDKNLWSARITQALRAIVYQDGDTWALMYAGQHDDAYSWAENRRVELNARTGALQIVEFTETVEQQLGDRPAEQPGLFDAHSDDYLLSLGLPPSWLPVTRQLATEADLFLILDKLPEEVAERLLSLAEGVLVTPPLPANSDAPQPENEDTRRRFITITSSDELNRVLDAPFATWIGFLHPSQRKLATGNFKGPVKVTGSAGTGKTIVAMHRARYLARQGKQVLVTSFVGTLCDNIYRNLKLLCSEDELKNITVTTVASQAGKVLKQGGLELRAVSDDEIQQLLYQQVNQDCPLDRSALWLEWKWVIQPHGIATWEEYRKVSRAGRGQSLSLKGRKQVWTIFDAVFSQLRLQNQIDWAGYYRQAFELLTSGQVSSAFDAVIVDEVQDLRPQELKFLAALAGTQPNSLMMVGDGGQRIYQGRFSLKSLGINVQGRSHILKINYRTTEQIRRFADRLIDAESDDLDGGKEKRSDTISLFKGPEPSLHPFSEERQQAEFVATEIQALLDRGFSPGDIGIFGRTKRTLEPVERQLAIANIPYLRLDQPADQPDAVHTGTMHRAKGLEFKAVFVVHASEGLIPLPQSLEGATDPQSLEEAIAQEKHLLYVSVTRARDLIYLCWVGQPSRFLPTPGVSVD